MTLWTAGVFSTTTMWSPSGPPKPSSAMAAVPSASSRLLYSGSAHARATTFAPFIGPISDSTAGDLLDEPRGHQPPLGQQRLQRRDPPLHRRHGSWVVRAAGHDRSR